MLDGDPLLLLLTLATLLLPMNAGGKNRRPSRIVTNAAPMEPTLFTVTYARAVLSLPASISLTTSTEKVEKVVSAPQKPTPSRAFCRGGSTLVGADATRPRVPLPAMLIPAMCQGPSPVSQSVRQAGSQAGRQAGSQAVRQAGRQTNRQTGRPAGRQAGRTPAC